MRIFIPEPFFVVSLVPDPMKNTADPDPTRCDSKSRGLDPFRVLIPDPVYLVTTLLYSLEHLTAILHQSTTLTDMF